VHGSAAIARTLHAIGCGRAEPSAFADLRRYIGAVGGRGACHLPDGLAHFVATALRTFAGEFEQHAANGPCDACAAPALLTIPAPQPMPA
jgi:NADH:ubiquinone oxidoreductase subunit F (NADH-binding)